MAKFNNTPEERAALLEECKGSGLPGSEFCRRRGIGYSTMFKWLRDAGMPVQKEQERMPEEAPRFVELEMEGRENGAARPVLRVRQGKRAAPPPLCARS